VDSVTHLLNWKHRPDHFLLNCQLPHLRAGFVSKWQMVDTRQTVKCMSTIWGMGELRIDRAIKVSQNLLALWGLPLLSDYKQSLGEVFVISRIILIILIWISQKPNLITVLFYIGRNTKSNVCASSLMASKTKRVDLTWLPL